MFPYRLRPPVGERSIHQKRGRAAISKDKSNRGGGALERAIRDDIRNVQKLYLTYLKENRNFEDDLYGFEHGFLHKCVNGHWPVGMSFSRFKNIVYKEIGFDKVFQLRKSGVIPLHCHEDGFVQIVYSTCLHMLADGLFDNTVSDGTEKLLFPDKVAFLVFLLYSLYQTYPRPSVRDLIDEATKCTDNNKARSKWLKLLLPLNLRRDHMESKFYRRAFRAPIRISQAQFVLLHRIHDLALETMSKCEIGRMKVFDSYSGYNSENISETKWHCNCNRARDTLEIIDLMYHDESFELCEYSGPGSLEGFAGNDPHILQSTHNAAMNIFPSSSVSSKSDEISIVTRDIEKVIDINRLNSAVDSYVNAIKDINPSQNFSGQSIITSSRQSAVIEKAISPLRSTASLLDWDLSLEFLLDICNRYKDGKTVHFPIEITAERERKRNSSNSENANNLKDRFGRRFGLRERIIHAGISSESKVDEKTVDDLIDAQTSAQEHRLPIDTIPSFLELDDNIRATEKQWISEALQNFVPPSHNNLNQTSLRDTHDKEDDHKIATENIMATNSSLLLDVESSLEEQVVPNGMTDTRSLASMSFKGISMLDTLFSQVQDMSKSKDKFRKRLLARGDVERSITTDEVSQSSTPVKGSSALNDLLHQVSIQNKLSESSKSTDSDDSDQDSIDLMTITDALSLASIPLGGSSALNDLFIEVERQSKSSRKKRKKYSNEYNNSDERINESGSIPEKEEISLASVPLDGNLALNDLLRQVETQSKQSKSNRKKRKKYSDEYNNSDERINESGSIPEKEEISLASVPLDGNLALNDLLRQVEIQSKQKRKNISKPTYPDIKEDNGLSESNNPMKMSEETSVTSLPLAGSSALDDLFGEVKKKRNYSYRKKVTFENSTSNNAHENDDEEVGILEV